MLVKLAFTPRLFFFPKKAPTFLGDVFGKALYCVFTDFSEYGTEISPISQKILPCKHCQNLLQKKEKKKECRYSVTNLATTLFAIEYKHFSSLHLPTLIAPTWINFIKFKFKPNQNL